MTEYNRIFTSDSDASAFIRSCEADFTSQVNGLTDIIHSDRRIKFILLSGPTCSGKTTAARIIKDTAKVHNIDIQTVSIDDFYRCIDPNDVNWHKKDMESVDAIDLEYFRECVTSIEKGGEVSLPIFNFGLRSRSGCRKLDITENTVVMFEGIQAFYPEINSMFSDDEKLNVSISVQNAVKAYGTVFSPRQIRLSRRLIRDMLHRNTSPEMLLDIWVNVVKNEISNIEPYTDTARYYIDSTVPYEFNVLSYYMRLLHSGDRRVNEITEKYKDFPVLSPDLVPTGALFREFI